MKVFLLVIQRGAPSTPHRLVGVYSTHEAAEKRGYEDKVMRDDLKYYGVLELEVDAEPEIFERD